MHWGHHKRFEWVPVHYILCTHSKLHQTLMVFHFFNLAIPCGASSSVTGALTSSHHHSKQVMVHHTVTGDWTDQLQSNEAKYIYLRSKIRQIIVPSSSPRSIMKWSDRKAMGVKHLSFHQSIQCHVVIRSKGGENETSFLPAVHAVSCGDQIGRRWEWNIVPSSCHLQYHVVIR